MDIAILIHIAYCRQEARWQNHKISGFFDESDMSLHLFVADLATQI